MMRLLRITIPESSDEECNWRYGVQFFRRIGYRRIGKTPSTLSSPIVSCGIVS